MIRLSAKRPPSSELARAHSSGRASSHVRDPQQGVDPGIAGHHECAPSVYAFAQQIVARPRRRGKMQIGDAGDEPAVHLLRPRRIDVAGAQAGFDMRHRDLVIEGGERPAKVDVVSPCTMTRSGRQRSSTPPTPDSTAPVR